MQFTKSGVIIYRVQCIIICCHAVFWFIPPTVCDVYKLICYNSCPFIMTGFFAHKQYKIWSLGDCTIIHKIRDLTTTEYTWRGCHNNSTNRKNSHWANEEHSSTIVNIKNKIQSNFIQENSPLELHLSFHLFCKLWHFVDLLLGLCLWAINYVFWLERIALDRLMWMGFVTTCEYREFTRDQQQQRK